MIADACNCEWRRSRPEAARIAVEESWQRRHPHAQLDREAMRSLLGVAVLDSEVLSSGLRQ